MNQAEGNQRIEVERKGKWLLARFSEPHVVLSWAVVRGGKSQTETVAWYQVTQGELAPPMDPKEFLKRRLAEASLHGAVGLLTSVNLDFYADREKNLEGISVRSIVTVGLHNSLRVGDLPRAANPVVGTINLLCQISLPLSKEAFLEALCLATEARTAALLESGIPSVESGRPATGTGTDCIVMAAPRQGVALRYVGKHTLAGHLIGASVLEAVRSGLHNPQRENLNQGNLLPPDSNRSRI